MTRSIKLEFESSPGTGLMGSDELRQRVLRLPRELKENVPMFGDDCKINYRFSNRRTKCSKKCSKSGYR